jgi:hypothetical protein
MRARGSDLLVPTVRAIGIGEDSIHAVVSVLLVFGVRLVVDTVHHTVVILAGAYNLPVIVHGVLDEILLFF